MTKAFYERVGDVFEPTGYVRGPWSMDHCHAGPPAALLANQMGAMRPDMGMTRATVEIAAPIPLKPVRVETEVVRPGKKVTRVASTLVGIDGTHYATASAWLMRIDTSVMEATGRRGDPPPSPGDCPVVDIEFWGGEPEILQAVEMRAARGQPFNGQGQATAWMRIHADLIAGQPLTPEDRVMTVADFLNGISAIKPLSELLSINTDVTVYLGRRPVGDWIALDASTNSSGLGLGMTDSLLYDASGFVGTANQSIFFDSLIRRELGNGI